MTTPKSVLMTAVVVGLALTASAHSARAESEVTFGGQWWSQTQPEAKFQEFRDIPRGPFLESFILKGWQNQTSWLLTGNNAMRKDQETKLQVRSGGRWLVEASYQGIPHLFSEVARSPFTEIAPGVFVLPDSVQIHNQRNPDSGPNHPYTNTMEDLMSSSPFVPLGFQTRVSKARVKGRLPQGWQIELSGVERQRSGNKAYGTPFGFNSELELWEPIDQRMIDTDLKASWHHDRVTFQASAGLSAFKNNVTRLLYDNPKRLTDTTYSSAYVSGDGSSKGQTAMYPDNRVIRGALAVAISLPQRSFLDATLGVSQSTQNQTDWLPISVNSTLGVDTIPMPGTRTDGKANILTEDVRLVTRAFPKFTGGLRYHGYKYDNKTPEWTFPVYARLDAVLEPGVTSEPFGNEQRTLGVDGDFDLGSGVSVGGSYEYEQRLRTHREVDKNTENRFLARGRAQVADGLMLNARYQHGVRKLDSFDITSYQASETDTTLVEQPGLRRYDVADRTQDQVVAGFAWSIGDMMDVSTTYSYLKNAYDESVYGLQLEKQQMVQADATVHANEQVDLHAGGGVNQTKTLQKSNESNPPVTADVATDWKADLKDLNTYLYAGADWMARPEKLTFMVNYQFTRDYSGFRLSNTAMTAQDLPSTNYRRHEFEFETSYRLFKNTKVSGRYQWEEFDVTDFSAEDVPNITLSGGNAAAIYLGAFYRDYRAHRLALLVNHTF